MKILSLIETFTKVEETHAQQAPTSRRQAFSKFGDVAIDLAKVAAPFGVAALMPNRAQAQTGNNAAAIEVLNFALLLEYLEAEYYVRGLDTNGLLTGDTRAVIEQISKHETAHVALLQGAIAQLGGTARDKPEFDYTADGAFGTVFSDPAIYLAVAQAFEDTGVRAYKGQAGNLLGTDLLTTALRIHSVEARHAAMIRRMRGLQGWIPFADGIPGVAAAQAVYAGEANVTQLGINADGLAMGVSTEAVTEAYDEPLTRNEVTMIVTPFLA